MKDTTTTTASWLSIRSHGPALTAAELAAFESAVDEMFDGEVTAAPDLGVWLVNGNAIPDFIREAALALGCEIVITTTDSDGLPTRRISYFPTSTGTVESAFPDGDAEIFPPDLDPALRRGAAMVIFFGSTEQEVGREAFDAACRAVYTIPAAMVVTGMMRARMLAEIVAGHRHWLDAVEDGDGDSGAEVAA